MRIHCISDLHGNLPEIPECDLLLIAGDYWGYGYCFGSEKSQAKWLRHHLQPWLSDLRNSLRVQEVVAIAGNHDGIFERTALGVEVPELEWTYLENSNVMVNIGGQEIRIYGNPWTPWFHDWAFNLPRKDMQEETLMRGMLKNIPEGIDIVISHGPPFEVLDMTNDYRNVGSRALREMIEVQKPALVVCGHIHEARGVKQCGDTIVVNASIVGPVGHLKTHNGFTLEGASVRALTLV